MNMRQRYFVSAAMAIGFLGLSISGVAYAQEMACAEETRTLCADVQPGGGRILQCLRNNESKLSLACAKRVRDLQEAASGPLGACREDWVAYCYHPRASTDRQAILQCLQAHQAEVSAGCQKALQGTSGKRQQPRGTMP